MAQMGDFTFNTSGSYYPMTVTTGGTAVWNRSNVTLQPQVAPAPEPEKPTDWLRRRVEELRVDLKEAA